MVNTPNDAATRLAAELRTAPLPTRGISWFTRTVKGHPYWYQQFVLGPIRRSTYLGPDGPEMRQLIALAREFKSAALTPAQRALLAVANPPSPAAAAGRVLEAAAQAGVFDAGGVLLSALTGNPKEVTIAVPNRTLDLVTHLREGRRAILPVPLFNSRAATTELQLRGQHVTLRLLTPPQGKSSRPQRYLPSLRVVADVADVAGDIESAVDAVCAHGTGFWIRVPKRMMEQE